MATYTETWPTNGAITSGQDQSWTAVSGTWAVTSGEVGKSANANTIEFARMNSDASGLIQYVQAEVRAPTAGKYPGLCLRMNASDKTCYMVRWTTGNFYIDKSNSTGTLTNLLTKVATAPTVGQVVKMVAYGTTPTVLTIYCDGTAIATITDSSSPITSGTRGGMTLYGTGTFLDNFEFGDATLADGIAIATGDWSSSSTWSNGNIPGSGSTAANIAAGITVSVTSDTVFGDGTASTNLVCYGALSITGASFTLKGNAQLQPASGSDTATPILTLSVANNGSTPGGIIFDGNSGVRPTVTCGSGCKMTFTGTATAPFYVRTKSTSTVDGTLIGITSGYSADGSNSAGSKAIFTVETNKNCSVEASYGVFHKIGDSSTAGMATIRANRSGCSCLFSNVLIDTCGNLPTTSFASGGEASNYSITDCEWYGPVGTSPASPSCRNSATGTRDFLRNVVRGAFNIGSGQQSMTIKNNLFLGECHFNRQTVAWTAFEDNFLLCDVNAFYEAGGTINNNLILLTDNASRFLGQYGGCNYTNNVIDYLGTLGDRLYVFSTGEVGLGAGDTSYNFKNNILLPTTSGLGMGQLTWPRSYDQDGSKKISYVEHNTVYVGANTSGAAKLSNTNGTQYAGELASFKSNIIWTTATTAGTTHAIDNAHDANAVTDAVAAANITHNCWLGLDAIGAGTWSGVTGDTGISGGTVYNSPMSGATAPGANDLTSTNPNFVDSTRNIATYDSAATGLANSATAWADTGSTYNVGDYVSSADAGFCGGATVNFRCISAHAPTGVANDKPGVGSAWRTYWELATIQRFRLDRTLPATCRDWIKAGLKPRNSSLKNAGHDGVTIGAVEGQFGGFGDPLQHSLSTGITTGL